MMRSLVAALVLLVSLTASAAEVTSADAAAIRAVVQRQLDAFARDDA